MNRTFVICAALCLLACGCSTSYHKKNFTGGYSEMVVRENVFQVWYEGHSGASRQRVEDSLLYRCAEITIASGGDYFIILDGDTRSVTRTVRAEDEREANRQLGLREVQYGQPLLKNTAPFRREHSCTSFNATSLIQVRRGEIPGGMPNALRARDVIEQLGPYVRG
jgi:hypothetical protein